MNSRKIYIRIGAILILCLAFNLAFAQKNPPKLTVFFSPSCSSCSKARQKVIPPIQKEFSGKIEIEYRDISDVDNYMYLLRLRDKYKPDLPIEVPVFFMEGNLISGKGNLRDNLEMLIIKSLAQSRPKEQLPEIDLIMRFKNFRPLAVTGAGLIDGINPCAFTVIVFFISFLALQGYRKRELISIGLSFVFAVFLTYLFIGLGIFNFLYSLKGFWIIARVFNIVIGVFSIILGIFAILDYLKFRKTQETEGLFLQLPRAVKNRIHSIIGLHYRKTSQGAAKQHVFRLLISALVTGFLVSILEAVCTGQVYLPTIIFVLKTTHLKVQAFGLLLLYNLMFIVPLLIIFLLALLGVTSGEFAKFLKRRMGLIKILMACVFFGLGIFLLWRA
ncbi:MAG: hypothetical protein A3K83_00570 [Omnitrophica WOR_2 bacterium RBG_13_44_8b]|nr:MAG: hypothetical protein A3K83_00570 [Omnitrophica WOR_2 bacterium RBG_13_44_8b]